MTQAEVMEIVFQLPSNVKISSSQKYNHEARKRFDLILLFEVKKWRDANAPSIPQHLYVSGCKYTRQADHTTWGALNKRKDGTYYRSTYPIYAEVPE